MMCEVCGQGIVDGVALYRNNPKGEEGVWRCEFHVDQQPDDSVLEITRAIEQGGGYEQ